MLLKRKGWLRKEYDEKLLNQLVELKKEWNNQNSLVEKSFDPSEEVIWDAKLVEAKYFFLFKEAKKRNISIR
ncbi:YaaL family protein [Cytobacillus sp. Hz8]|uniref:YaaL family protein n=1 Tax=Cytobacillus sp. Hz8 TaxID=3347168 RepID=UPI0035E0020F